MTKENVTPELLKAVAKFYGLESSVVPVSRRDVVDEYKALARKGFAGICGDVRREALRDIFARHGYDPVHGQ